MTTPAALGSTTDPKALVPGEPEAVEADADALRAVAEDTLTSVSHQLFAVRIDSWSGPAAEAFWGAFTPETTNWGVARDGLTSGAATLTGYAWALREAQKGAKSAIDLWTLGDVVTARAHAEYQEAVAQVQASGTAVAIPMFHDPGAQFRVQAREVLDRAKAQLAKAAEEAAFQLHMESGSREGRPNWLFTASTVATSYLDKHGPGDTTVGDRIRERERPVIAGVESGSDDGGNRPRPEDDRAETTVNLVDWGAEANIFTVTKEGHTRLGDITLHGTMEAKVGTETNASFSIHSGALEAEVSARTGASVTVDGTATYGVVEARGHAEAVIGAEASGNFMVGPSGVASELEAFVGGQLEGEVDVDVGPVGGGVDGEVSAGLGAEATGYATFEDGKFTLSGHAALTLGIGAGLGGEITIDVGEIAESIGELPEQILEHSHKLADGKRPWELDYWMSW